MADKSRLHFLTDTDIVRALLSFAVLIITTALTAMFLFLPPPTETMQILSMFYGGLMTKFKQAWDFFFSSSDGSKRKGREMARDDVPEPAQPQPEITQAPPPKQGFGSF